MDARQLYEFLRLRVGHDFGWPQWENAGEANQAAFRELASFISNIPAIEGDLLKQIVMSQPADARQALYEALWKSGCRIR